MLQQTRVETVKEYYIRFLARFPDITSLATAPQQDVLKQWEGLGYYSRARNLQKAAQMIIAQFGGKFPREYSDLLSLPGIGAYTAGAIASIAYNQKTPAIDGNVKRVASRLFGIRVHIESKQALHSIELGLQEALDPREAGALNQGLMELGATLCTPHTPKCDLCPIASTCDAYAEGDQESLPIHEKKQPAKTVDVAVCLLTYANQVLLCRRHERLLHGLYVFPLVEMETDPQRIQAWLSEMGLQIRYQNPLGEAKHLFTHRIWQMQLWHYHLLRLPSEAWLLQNDAILADWAMLCSLPLPTAMKTAKAEIKKLIET